MLTMAQTATNNIMDNAMLAIKETGGRAALFKMKGAGKAADKIDAAANEFESQFISQMMSTMFSTVDKSDDAAGGGSDAEDVYESMLTNEYGKIIARTGGVGVADQVKRVMLDQQEVR